MERSIFSIRLTTLRKDRNMTQEDVAKVLGISRSAYTCYETGMSMPGAATLCEIADLFQVNLDYLLGRGEDPEMYDPTDTARAREEIQLMDRFRRIGAKGRRAVMEMAALLDSKG